jgi:hypothetical protein
MATTIWDSAWFYLRLSRVGWQENKSIELEKKRFKDVSNFVSILIPVVSLILTVLVASKGSKQQMNSFETNTQKQIECHEKQTQRVVDVLKRIEEELRSLKSVNVATNESLQKGLKEIKSKPTEEKPKNRVRRLWNSVFGKYITI